MTYSWSSLSIVVLVEPVAAAHSHVPIVVLQIVQQPDWVFGGPLHSHQLEALHWLRQMWVNNQPAIVADEMGLGKTATVIAFLSSLLYEFKVTAPILVVVPVSMLNFWEGVCGGGVGGGGPAEQCSVMITHSMLWLCGAANGGTVPISECVCSDQTYLCVALRLQTEVVPGPWTCQLRTQVYLVLSPHATWLALRR